MVGFADAVMVSETSGGKLLYVSFQMSTTMLPVWLASMSTWVMVALNGTSMKPLSPEVLVDPPPSMMKEMLVARSVSASRAASAAEAAAAAAAAAAASASA